MSFLGNSALLSLVILDMSLLSNFGCISFLSNSEYVTLLTNFGCNLLVILDIGPLLVILDICLFLLILDIFMFLVILDICITCR